MQNFIKSKLLMVTIALVLVIGLICGSALPVMAKDNDKGKSNTDTSAQMTTIKGPVTDIEDDDSFVVTTDADEETTVTITVDENTKYYLIEAGPYAVDLQNRMPNLKNNQPNNLNQRGLGDNDEQTEADSEDENEADSALDNPELEQGLNRNWQGPRGMVNKFKSWFGKWQGFGEAAEFGDIEEGDRVIVRVMPNETLAKQVLIIKPSHIKKVSGSITDVNDDSFTIDPADEDADNIDLVIDENTRVILIGLLAMDEEQWAVVVYEENDDENLAVTVKVTESEPE